MEVSEARGTFDTLRKRLDNSDNKKADKTEVDNLQNQIKSLASGSPKGTYASVEALETANPETGVYIITTNGHIYSWTKNAENAIDLGLYQSTGISDNSIDYNKFTENLQKSVLLKLKYFYEDFKSIVNNVNFSIGTQLNTGYYNITRNKAITFDGSIKKVFINISTVGHKGLLKLQRLSYKNNELSLVEEDLNSYEIIYGNNEIELNTPFKVYSGDYIGFTITPNTEEPYPVGYCNISAVNNSSYNYGIIAKRYSDNNTTTIINLTPAFDFEIESPNFPDFLNYNISNPWFYGKSWVAYGDSITAGYGLPNHSPYEMSDQNNLVNTYVKLIGEKYNMDFHNYGSSGRGYSIGTDENLKAYKLIENNHLDNIDIVTVALGTNDYGTLNEDNKVEFGDVTDLSSGSTFCSYVKKAFDALNTYYPNAVIIIMLPIPRKYLDSNNVMGKNLIDYCEAIKTIACYYGFYVMDCISISRSNVKSSSWVATYMQDNVHMTENYHKKYYAPMVEEQLKLVRTI